MIEICRWRHEGTSLGRHVIEFRIVHEYNNMLYGVYYSDLIEDGFLGNFIMRGKCRGESERCSCQGDRDQRGDSEYDVSQEEAEQIWDDVESYFRYMMI